MPEGEYLVPLGKADVKRPGKDATLVASSRMTLFALNAAEKLAQEGIEAEVVDLRTLRPLDIETIASSVRKTHRLVIVNEGARSGGISAEVMARAYEEVFDYLDAPIIRVAAEDVPLHYSEKLELAALPSEEKIMAAVNSFFH